MSWYNPFSWNFRFSLTDSQANIAQKVRAQGIDFFQYGNDIKYISLENSGELKEAYEKCAPLSNIISSLGKVFSDAEIQVINSNTDKFVRGQYKDWEKLLRQPNPIQNQQQFFKQLYIYNKVNGFCFVMKNYGSNMEGTGYPPSSMYVLPYWLTEIDLPYKNYNDLELDDILDNVWLTANNGDKRIKIPKENLMLIKDTTGDLDDRYYLPISKVALNQYPISTIVSAAEADITLIQNKGAIGILSNKAQDDAGHQPMEESEKEAIQQQFSKYGLTRSQWQMIITNANIDYTPMAFNVRDLMLHETYAKGIKDLCDAFGYPYELLSHSERKNLSNVNSFDKILYQNTIIPEGNDIAMQMEMGLGLNKLSTPLIINFDYSHIQALQKSDEEKGKGRKALNEAYKMEWENGLITRNMWLEGIGEEPVQMEEFNKYKWELAAEMQQNIIDNAQGEAQQGNNGAQTDQQA